MPSQVVRLLRERHHIAVTTAQSVGMQRQSDKEIFDYCRQRGLVLVSFNVKDYWRIPLERCFGMLLLDLKKDSYRDVDRSFAEFFKHNGVVGRRSYTGGMLKLITSGYVMKYLYQGRTYQVEAQFLE